MSDDAAHRELTQKWAAVMMAMVDQGAEPEPAVSAMLATAIAGMKIIHPPARVAEMLCGMALNLVAEATRASFAAGADAARSQLEDILRAHIPPGQKAS